MTSVVDHHENTGLNGRLCDLADSDCDVATHGRAASDPSRTAWTHVVRNDAEVSKPSRAERPWPVGSRSISLPS